MSARSLWRGTVLITGTDTGVGKTYVGCGLARALRAAGSRVAVRKPAESGCELRDGVPFPADAAALRDAARSEESLETICALRLAEPLAPWAAAKRAGVRLDVPSLVRDYRARAAEVDCLLVEGAGGLLVPLDDGVSYADLARELGARLIVVVGARLGAINHTLLTLEAARGRGLEVLGLVVNHLSPAGDLATETLATTLREIAGAPLLAEVPWGADPAALHELSRRD